jgi:serine/threonine protein kinase
VALELGTLVADKYRIERVLGTGGMGKVYAAAHVGLGTKVALKFLHEKMLEHPKIVERFLREARATAQLGGEHICRVSDVGTLGGQPYLVMELLEGTDLAKLLARSGPLPVALACAYLLQACAGVAEAHAAGIVHRDLKPSNLFVTKRTDGSPLVKVLDFGVAKAPGKDPSFNLTQTTNVLGSPGYMSPEQLRSSKLVDARTDIWSLGTILYELVAGRPPFDAGSLTELALKIAMDPTPPLPFSVPELEGVIERCLAKDPRDRYRDVGELADALGPLAAPDARDPATAIKAVLESSPELDNAGSTVRIRGQTPRGAVEEPLPAADVSAEMSTPGDAAVTTLGRATGSREPDEPPSRARAAWLAAALIAVGGAAAAFAIVTRVAGGSSEDTRDHASAATPSSTPTPSPSPSASPSASPSPLPPPVAVPVAVDAAVLPSPPDAAIDAGHDTPKRRPPKRAPKQIPAAGSAAAPEDLGESRI